MVIKKIKTDNKKEVLMKKFLTAISFGERFFFASCFYLSMMFILFAITPNLPFSVAESGCGGEAPCGEGESCCGGACCAGTCINGSCCPSGHVNCNGTCCSSDDCINNTCCPSHKFCGNKCVSEDAVCCDERELTDDEQCCDGMIIPKNQKCCPSENGYPAHGCDGECCQGGCMETNEQCCEDGTHSVCGCCTEEGNLSSAMQKEQDICPICCEDGTYSICGCCSCSSCGDISTSIEKNEDGSCPAN